MTATSSTCWFSGKRFVARFGTARQCVEALDVLLGQVYTLHAVEMWQQRDRVPPRVLAALLARQPGFDLLSLIVCDDAPARR